MATCARHPGPIKQTLSSHASLHVNAMRATTRSPSDNDVPVDRARRSVALAPGALTGGPTRSHVPCAPALDQTQTRTRFDHGETKARLGIPDRNADHFGGHTPVATRPVGMQDHVAPKCVAQDDVACHSRRPYLRRPSSRRQLTVRVACERSPYLRVLSARVLACPQQVS
jgi:hypothetical protein